MSVRPDTWEPRHPALSNSLPELGVMRVFAPALRQRGSRNRQASQLTSKGHREVAFEGRRGALWLRPLRS